MDTDGGSRILRPAGPAAPLGSASELVDAVSDANISMSGLPTIDGIQIAAGMRVLLTAQTVATQNGVYRISATAWKKNAPLQAPTVAAKTGTAYGLTWWVLQSKNVYKQVAAASASIVSLVATALVTASGAQTIDGVAVTNNALVLLTLQGGSNNGVWKVNTSGPWTKAGPFTPSLAIATGGSAYAGTMWAQTALNTYAIIVGGYG